MGLLSKGSVAAKKEFRRQQQVVKKAVDSAREEWIKKMAVLSEAAVKDGKTRWECIRRLQQTHAGCRPITPSAVRKEDGELTQNQEEMLQRWHQYFNKVLNQQSEFSEEVIQQMPILPPCLDLDEPPTEEELATALAKMKMRKAGGKTGILPEMVLFGGGVLWDRVLELMQVIWSEGEVVDDWKNADVVPMPKKGDRPAAL